MRLIKLTVLFLSIQCVYSCAEIEARRPVSQKSGTFFKESVQRNIKLTEEDEALIQAIIKKDTSKTYYPTESGFWYAYIKKDSLGTKKPQVGEEVHFIYSLSELDGTAILSTAQIGKQAYVIDKSNQDLIRGIREGLKLMKVGETVHFLLPSHLAYGYYGLEEYIGTNVPIGATITLQTIEE